MKTFNRGRLRRLAQQGKLELVESYHFDDTLGESRTDRTMPVALRPADSKDRKEGVCYLFESDFTAGCGRAWLNQDGTITLYVHSNCNYTLRMVA
jgi:hypothetical protein